MKLLGILFYVARQHWQTSNSEVSYHSVCFSLQPSCDTREPARRSGKRSLATHVTLLHSKPFLLRRLLFELNGLYYSALTDSFVKARSTNMKVLVSLGFAAIISANIIFTHVPLHCSPENPQIYRGCLRGQQCLRNGT